MQTEGERINLIMVELKLSRKDLARQLNCKLFFVFNLQSVEKVE